MLYSRTVTDSAGQRTGGRRAGGKDTEKRGSGQMPLNLPEPQLSLAMSSSCPWLPVCCVAVTHGWVWPFKPRFQALQHITSAVCGGTTTCPRVSRAHIYVYVRPCVSLLPSLLPPFLLPFLPPPLAVCVYASISLSPLSRDHIHQHESPKQPLHSVCYPRPARPMPSFGCAGCTAPRG